MLSDTNLQELLTFRAEQPVLSIYLNTDPTLGSADAYKLELRNMLKHVDLPEDVQAVENYFGREFDWSGKSVAVFSCAPRGFFRAYTLAVPVRSRVRQGNQPYVKPLADLLDFYGGYGVVLIDKQGARLFSFHLGALREQEGTMGEAVRHTKRGGASTFPGRRGGIAGQTNYAEEVAERNMREAVTFSTRFFSENNIRRILIGGTDENTAMFRGMLPKSWQSLVVGTFPMSMTASAEEVLAKAMEIGKRAEARQEEAMLEKLITAASKGRGGVMGLDNTLGALHEGRVQTLLIREGYRAPGYRCRGCGHVTAQELESCPYCGGAFEQIPDAVEEAVHKVMRSGGEVEVLQHPSQVRGFDNIGALLRY
jgi:peptide subunit release factor 1 (eRF1)